MKSIKGRLPGVTAAQVESILEWQRNRRTIEDWARILGVSRNVIIYALKSWKSPQEWNSSENPAVRQGRRRDLTVSEVQTLLIWDRTRMTRAQLAKALQLPKWQIGNVITRRGKFKRCFTEEYEAVQAAQRAKLESLEASTWRRPSKGVESPFVRLRAENAARFRAYLAFGNT